MVFLFWLALLLLLFSFVGYGLLLTAFGACFPPRGVPRLDRSLRVSFLIAAHNEGAVIRDKINNILEQDSGLHQVNIVIVSDGSDDNTVDIARSFDHGVTVLEAKQHIGKLAAINWGMDHCEGEIVVCSDANSLFPAGTLEALLRHFSDPRVGGGLWSDYR